MQARADQALSTHAACRRALAQQCMALPLIRKIQIHHCLERFNSIAVLFVTRGC
jgi:hypothetical protein